jgi:ubiquinone/menaquinone biosynthesis C-methylase UbiE
MNDAATYLFDGNRLSADQCRSLLGTMPLLDRQAKVLARIEGDTILDVGCQTGLFVREASRRFPDKTIIGLDYSDDNVRIAQLLHPQLGGRFRQMTAYRLDFPDESIDCITFQEVLEHLEGAALAVKEANRVLKVGGVLIISVPNPYYAWRIATFVLLEIANTVRGWRGHSPRLGTEILADGVEWDRHVHAWTPQTLLTLLRVNGFAYVDHCYENGAPNRLRRWFLAALPFLGPTQILKVRKVEPAPPRLV